MSVLTGVLTARTTQAGQIKLKTTQQGVSQTRSHDLRGNALTSSMSDPHASANRQSRTGLASSCDPGQAPGDRRDLGDEHPRRRIVASKPQTLLAHLPIGRGQLIDVDGPRSCRTGWRASQRVDVII